MFSISSTPIRAVIVSCGVLAACTANHQPSAKPPAPTASEGDKAQAIFEQYFEDRLQLNPIFATAIGDNRYNDRIAISISPAFQETQRQLARHYLKQLDAIDTDKLDEQDRLSYEILRQSLLLSLEAAQYPTSLIPVSQLFSIPNFIAQMGAGGQLQPFQTVADYDNWLGRISDFSKWIDQAIVNMRTGMDQGVVQPKVIMQKTIPQLAAHVVEDVEQSLFYLPIKNLPESFSAAERERLNSAYRAAIRDTIVPAYKKLHDFIRDEYMPQTRDTVAWSALPNGRAWYQFLVKAYTTIDMDVDEIHELGLREVRRIRTEIEEVMKQVGFSGSLSEWFAYCQNNDRFYFSTEAELLDGYRALEARMNAQLDRLFTLKPKAGFEIRPIEKFRAESAAGAQYVPPTPDGSRPGVFYVNTHDLKAQAKFDMESLYIHEAVPGHHFQIALQMEMAALPRFRRFSNYTAYTEGWGLYAESLGKELGFYAQPMQWYGRLNNEMLRAMRLVVDTGLHAQGWSRERAIAFMQANSSLAESEVVAEVERYIAVPAQALAYKIGELTISRLRAKAQQQLDDAFDIRAFHAEVLMHGALPLTVLEAKIDRWIAGQR